MIRRNGHVITVYGGGAPHSFFFFWLDVAYEYEMFCFFLLSSCALLCPRFFFPSHCNFIPSSVTGSCVVIDSSVSFKFACPLSNLAHAFSLPRILSSFSVSLTLQRCIVIFKCFPPPFFFLAFFLPSGRIERRPRWAVVLRSWGDTRIVSLYT